MNDVIVSKIFNNILNNSIILASPSKCPNYRYHWIRDSALTIRTIINLYNKDKKPNYYYLLNNYIINEDKVQKYHLGEPKFNTDLTKFSGEWGRPQNDGPALRGLNMLKLLHIFPSKEKQINKIIERDLHYTIENLHNPCFDLWEEQYGYHLYTRLVQAKFLKEYCQDFADTRIKEKYNELKTILGHHITKETIYSSFTSHGTILRQYDSSLLLGLNHIDYDEDIIDIHSDSLKNYVASIINIFKRKYNINNILQINFLGRYKEDRYYDGNPWIICTLSLFQYYTFIGDKHDSEIIRFFIFCLYKKLNLSEQINSKTFQDISALNLTWNYSELLNLMELISFKNPKLHSIIEVISTS